MIKSVTDISLRKAALLAGFSYIVLLMFNTIAHTYSLNNLIVLGDATATFNNILTSESLFRIGIAGWLMVLVTDVVIAWALYIFLKPVDKNLSLLMASFRLLFVVIAASTFVYLLSVLYLFSSAHDLIAFQSDQLSILAMLFLNPYGYGFNIAFVFFGLHILILGFLAYKSDYIPKVLGIFLIIASLGYLIDSFGSILFSSYAENEILYLLLVALPALIAEYSFTIWLLVRGGKN